MFNVLSIESRLQVIRFLLFGFLCCPFFVERLKQFFEQTYKLTIIGVNRV